MLAKIVVFILAMALVSIAVLVTRQLRTQALSEAAATRLRIVEADAALWRLRAEIAQRSSPSAIQRVAGESLEMAPLRLGPDHGRMLEPIQ